MQEISTRKILFRPFQSCKVTCVEGYKFPDGSLTSDIKCKNGDWKMEPRHFLRCEREFSKNSKDILSII